MLSYSWQDEWDFPVIWDYVSSLNEDARIELWNEAFPNIKIEDKDPVERIEIFERMTEAYTPYVVKEFKTVLRKVLFQEHVSEIIKEPSFAQVREKTITELFKKDDKPVFVQQVMGI